MFRSAIHSLKVDIGVVRLKFLQYLANVIQSRQHTMHSDACEVASASYRPRHPRQMFGSIMAS